MITTEKYIMDFVRFLLILPLIIVSFHSAAQNLVPNPSFENHGPLPCSWVTSRQEFATSMQDWTAPTEGTSDIINTKVPDNCYSSCNSTNPAAQGRQLPRTGEVNAGIFVYNGGNNYREYLQVKLASPLVVGKNYHAEMYVSLADFSGMATDNLGMYFSDTIIESSTYFSLPYSPHILETNIISDSVNWVKVSGKFMATSPSEYLLIGNFFSDSETNRTNSLIENSNAYYFIDDVYVGLQCDLELGNDTSLCYGDSLILDATNYEASYLWQDNSTSPTLKVSKEGLYYVEVKNEYCNIRDSIVISIQNLPTISLMPLTICEGNEVSITPVSANTKEFLWSTGDTTESITVNKEGYYKVTGWNECGTSLDSIDLKSIPLPVTSLSNDTTIILGTSAQLYVSGGVSYVWNPSVGLSCNTCPNPITAPLTTSTYYVSITGENGCMVSDSVVVFVDVDLYVYIPNIFSPNGDGQNDMLFVRGKGIKQLKFSIYDRWGERVFETTDMNQGWDGRYRGQVLNPAVFVYMVDAILESGQRILKKGDLTLIK